MHNIINYEKQCFRVIGIFCEQKLRVFNEIRKDNERNDQEEVNASIFDENAKNSIENE